MNIICLLCASALLFLTDAATAQMALVQRTDLALGSDRKGYAEWLLKQGFNFDTEGQELTRQMVSGMSSVLDHKLFGETYLNEAGNIRIRLFTDTTFRIVEIQIILTRPVPDEGEKFIASLKTIGYQPESRYRNRKDGSDNCLLTRDGRRFTIVQSEGKGYLLVKGVAKP